MPDLGVVALVSRVELGLGDLSLHVPGAYVLTFAGPGAVSWRRSEATSPYVHGGYLYAAVKETVRAPLGVRVHGADAAELESRVDAVIKAFSQFYYELRIELDGVAHEWACQPADWTVGDAGQFDKFGLMSLMQEVRFDVPRDPIPLVGSV